MFVYLQKFYANKTTTLCIITFKLKAKYRILAVNTLLLYNVQKNVIKKGE